MTLMGDSHFGILVIVTAGRTTAIPRPPFAHTYRRLTLRDSFTSYNYHRLTFRLPSAPIVVAQEIEIDFEKNPLARRSIEWSVDAVPAQLPIAEHEGWESTW